MPKQIWKKLRAILPHQSKDTTSPQAVIVTKDADARPSSGVFYAAGPSAGHDVTAVAFSRELSQPGITSHPVFVVRNLDERSEDDSTSLISSVDLYYFSPNYGVCSICAPSSQAFSEVKTDFCPVSFDYKQGLEEDREFGLENYPGSESYQPADSRISTPRQNGTSQFMLGYGETKFVDSNLAGLLHSEITLSDNSPTTENIQIPYQCLLL